MVITALDHVPHCFSRADGAVICRLLRSEIARHGKVTLSFSGVSDVPSSFVNAALVALLDDHSFDWIKQHVAIVNATRQTTAMIRRCFGGVQERVAA